MLTGQQRPRGRRSALTVAALALLTSAGVAAVVHHVVTTPHPAAAQRGAELFSHLGCSGCHGPGATGTIPDPKSEAREIPGFVGGTAMMYVETEADIRAWILDGHPAGKKAGEAGEAALVHMPAYRGRITRDELNDLVAYYHAAAAWEPDLPEDARRGHKVARDAGCFGCHGPGGEIGAHNPGSFKGYIPGWGSEDYSELVHNEDELRTWIREGKIPRLEDSALARSFTDGQLIKMPAYKNVLSGDEMDALVAYISWLARRTQP